MGHAFGGREDEDQRRLMRPQDREFGNELMILKLPVFLETELAAQEIIDKARKHRALIVDLRGNPGGVESTLQELLGGVFESDIKRDNLNVASAAKEANDLEDRPSLEILPSSFTAMPSATLTASVAVRRVSWSAELRTQFEAGSKRVRTQMILCGLAAICEGTVSWSILSGAPIMSATSATTKSPLSLAALDRQMRSRERQRSGHRPVILRPIFLFFPIDSLLSCIFHH